jgi:serine/threonine-protein kinase
LPLARNGISFEKGELMFHISEDMAKTLQKLSDGDADATIDMSTVRVSRSPVVKDFQPDDFTPELLEIHEILPGQTHFSIEVTNRIGMGGISLIDSARQLSLDREIAIKRLRTEKMDASSQKGLIAEAKRLAKLDHPNIVPVHQLGFDSDSRPVLVMKKIRGASFFQKLRRLRGQAPDPLVLKEHLQIFIRVCHALEYAHSKSIIHRDIKSANIMIGEFGEVYLLDWGIAAELNVEGEFVATSFCGTPNYVAPEMVHMKEALTVRTDVYLLGALLHEILTHQVLHSGKHFIEILTNALISQPFEYRNAHPRLAAICHQAMAVEQKDRFATIREFREAVEDYIERRSALTLLESTQQQLLALRVESAKPDSSAYQIYRLGFRCQFGFEQVLSQDSSLDQATTGLIETLEILFKLELQQKQFDLARKFLSEMKGMASAERFAKLNIELARMKEQHDRTSEITTQIQYRMMEKIQELRKSKKD